MATQLPLALSFLFTTEQATDGSTWFVAQCIECDLATQARSLPELFEETGRLLAAHLLSCEEEGIQPWRVPPVPDDVRAEFERVKAGR